MKKLIFLIAALVMTVGAMGQSEKEHDKYYYDPNDRSQVSSADLQSLVTIGELKRLYCDLISIRDRDDGEYFSRYGASSDSEERYIFDTQRGVIVSVILCDPVKVNSKFDEVKASIEGEHQDTIINFVEFEANKEDFKKFEGLKFVGESWRRQGRLVFLSKF